ncbi:MAG: hypothetical protein HY897_11015 [Deltaproteobacteria bacterium]|nr:hypothetical protein [Deltaproteobacteria bacterium]
MLDIDEWAPAKLGQSWAYRFKGKVEKRSLLGGASTNPGTVDGIRVEVFTLNPDTAERLRSNYSGTTDSSGDWGPTEPIREGSYLEMVTTTFAGGGTALNSVHSFFDLLSKDPDSGLNALSPSDAVLQASDEVFDPNDPKKPVSGVVLFRTNLEFTDVEDDLRLDLDGDGSLETDVITGQTVPQIPWPIGTRVNAISVYRANTANPLSFQGHLEATVPYGMLKYTWDWQASASERNLTGVNSAPIHLDPPIGSGYRAALIPMNHKACSWFEWLSNDGVEHCITGPAGISNQLLRTLYQYREVPQTGDSVFSAVPVDDRYLVPNVPRNPVDPEAPYTDACTYPRPYHFRPDLHFDEHHSLTTTRTTFSFAACQDTTDAEMNDPSFRCGDHKTRCICGRGRSGPVDYLDLEINGGFAKMEVKAVADMRLWFLLRSPLKGDEVGISEDPADYIMGFVTSDGKFVVFTHIYDPLRGKIPDVNARIGKAGMDSVYSGKTKDVAYPDKMFAPDVVVSNGTAIGTVTWCHGLGCQNGLYFPNDPSNGRFNFRAGEAIGIARFLPSEDPSKPDECHTDFDANLMDVDNFMLSFWEGYDETDFNSRAKKEMLMSAFRFITDPTNEARHMIDEDSFLYMAEGVMNGVSNFERCQYSSDPRSRQNPEATPRSSFDNKTYVMTNGYEDPLNVDDTLHPGMFAASEYSAWNCVDTRWICVGTFPSWFCYLGYSYQMRRVINTLGLPQSYVQDYLIDPAYMDLMEGALYRNVLWADHQAEIPVCGTGELKYQGVCETDCDNFGGNGDELLLTDPGTGETACYYKYLWVRMTYDQNRIRMCETSSETPPTPGNACWRWFTGRGTLAWAPAFFGFLNWR